MYKSTPISLFIHNQNIKKCVAIILEYLWKTCYIYKYNLINSKLYSLNKYIIENTEPESVYVVIEVKNDSYVLSLFYIIFKIYENQTFLWPMIFLIHKLISWNKSVFS